MWADDISFIKAWKAMMIEAAETQFQNIQIFVSDLYVDSVVSVKILTKLLRHFSITYSIFIVRNWNDLKKKIQYEHTNNNVTSQKKKYYFVA